MKEQRIVEVTSQSPYLSTESSLMDDLLHQLCQTAATSLRLDGVGVLAAEHGRSRFVHPGGRPGAPKNQKWQEALQDGPGKQAMTSLARVVARSAADLRRWPMVAKYAQELDVREVIAVPLLCHGKCWGVLFLWMREDLRAAAVMQAAQLLADVAATYVAMVAGHRQADSAHDRLADRLLRDSLTGLANREVMRELISHALASAARHSTSMATLFLDVDEFKKINDSYGHDAGDAVLQALAGRLKRTARDSDSVGRIGGDEFVVACEDLKGSVANVMRDMWSLARRLLSVVNEPIILSSQAVEVCVSVSIGIAITSCKRQVTDVLIAADAAMYEAKKLGGGKISIRHLDPSPSGWNPQSTPAPSDSRSLSASMEPGRA